VDISTLGLHSLRRAICFIQQDAILFSGSLRSNLDPFNEHSDAELEQALSEVDYARLSGNTEGVAFIVAESGANLSAGTRQLVTLARAICRRSRILLLDEATASTDYATDAVIQTCLRSRFSGSTILTIAHRLETVIDYDRLLVMSEGRVAECGTPTELLSEDASLFSALVGTGPAAARLHAAAAEASRKRGPE